RGAGAAGVAPYRENGRHRGERRGPSRRGGSAGSMDSGGMIVLDGQCPHSHGFRRSAAPFSGHRPSETSMIVEERIYTMQPGKVQEWLAFYGERGLPIQNRLLGKLIGFFSSEIGTLNQVVHLWAYDS